MSKPMSKIVAFRRKSGPEKAAEALRILADAWAYYEPARGKAELIEETALDQMFEYYAA